MCGQQNSPNHVLIAQEGPFRGCSMSRINIKLLMQAAAASSLILTILSFTVPAVADSQVRMVRLSEVQGDVQVTAIPDRAMKRHS